MAAKRPLGAGTTSKLATTAQSEPETVRPAPEPMGLVSRNAPLRKPRSYRLRPDDLERLSKIVESVNDLGAGRKITETDVLRGLIVLGTQTPGDRLIDAIRASLL